MPEHAHTHHDHGAGHGPLFDTPEMAAYAELEAEVLIDLMTDAVSRLAQLGECFGVPVRRVLDLGSGPGVASCLLAERFAGASVVAADGSAAMLERAAARAARLGLAARVETRLVELPDGLASLGPADLVWASLVIHHIGDEADVLARLAQVVEPGGLLAVVEFGDPSRVLPEDVDLGRPPGLWKRLDDAWAAWFTDMRAGLPGSTESAAYPAMLEAAGFEVVADELLTVDLEPPLGEQARRFARRQLEGARTRLAEYADTDDLDALEVLLDDQDEAGLLQRADVRLSASRRLYVARR